MEQSDWERVPSFAKNSTLKMQLFGLRSLQENNLCPLKALAGDRDSATALCREFRGVRINRQAEEV